MEAQHSDTQYRIFPLQGGDPMLYVGWAALHGKDALRSDADDFNMYLKERVEWRFETDEIVKSRTRRWFTIYIPIIMVLFAALCWWKGLPLWWVLAGGAIVALIRWCIHQSDKASGLIPRYEQALAQLEAFRAKATPNVMRVGFTFNWNEPYGTVKEKFRRKVQTPLYIEIIQADRAGDSKKSIEVWAKAQKLWEDDVLMLSDDSTYAQKLAYEALQTDTKPSA